MPLALMSNRGIPVCKEATSGSNVGRTLRFTHSYILYYISWRILLHALSKSFLCHLLLVLPLLSLCPSREECLQKSHAFMIEIVWVRCHHCLLSAQWTMRTQTPLEVYSATDTEDVAAIQTNCVFHSAAMLKQYIAMFYWRDNAYWAWMQDLSKLDSCNLPVGERLEPLQARRGIQ